MSAHPSDARQSTLLNTLGWVEHGFLPPGVRPPAATAWGQQRHTPLISEAEENFPPKQKVSDGVFSRHGRPVAVYTADCLPVLIGDRLDIGNYCTLRLKSNLQRKIPKDKKTTRQRSFYGKQRRLSLVVNKLNNQWIQLGRTFLG